MAIFSTDITVDNIPLSVDGSGVTQPVSAVSLPLPSGASTAAKQDTGNTSLSSLDSKTPAVGQTTMAGSRPVVIASNQSPIQILAATASISNITQITLVNNTNTTLLTSNVNRKKAIIFIATATVQIKLGVIASTTSFTYKVVTNNTTIEITGWTGQIDAFGSGGIITITELT